MRMPLTSIRSDESLEVRRAEQALGEGSADGHESRHPRQARLLSRHYSRGMRREQADAELPYGLFLIGGGLLVLLSPFTLFSRFSPSSSVEPWQLAALLFAVGALLVGLGLDLRHRNGPPF
jgi:hypothetical protein